jgi:hypothetical protein
MTAQTEFLWRLATEVQQLEDRARDKPPGQSERLLAEYLRELYNQIEQLPASHALFRHRGGAPRKTMNPSSDAALKLVASDHSALKP